MTETADINIELRVLVLTSTRKDADLTGDILKRAGIVSVLCSDLIELCSKLNEGAGAALIVEEALLSEQDEPLTRYVASQPPWSDLPLLILARSGADSASVAQAMDRLGNVTVLERPIRIASLVSAVRSALRARTRQYQVRGDAEALRMARDELEIRIRERTAELIESNSILEQKIYETEAAERRAHRLLSELVTAQESERARIARDLHDELGQQLTSLRLHLGQLERELPKRSRARAVLSLTMREAEKIDTRISFLAWMIRPTTIEELGLAKALDGYVREWSRNVEISVELQVRQWPEERLVPEIEVNIYRIAQECLNNIAKYSEATVVALLLTVVGKELTLIVEDNGKGFDPAAIGPGSSGGGLGIRGMTERAALLKGSLEVESSPGAGTTVYVRIPARFRAGQSEPAAAVQGRAVADGKSGRSIPSQ